MEDFELWAAAPVEILQRIVKLRIDFGFPQDYRQYSEGLCMGYWYEFTHLLSKLPNLIELILGPKTPFCAHASAEPGVLINRLEITLDLPNLISFSNVVECIECADSLNCIIQAFKSLRYLKTSSFLRIEEDDLSQYDWYEHDLPNLIEKHCHDHALEAIYVRSISANTISNRGMASLATTRCSKTLNCLMIYPDTPYSGAGDKPYLDCSLDRETQQWNFPLLPSHNMGYEGPEVSTLASPASSWNAEADDAESHVILNREYGLKN
ncbi:hypothetical protein I302_108273 [Kwoniella bestiolae CBS 10118]|uniref:Uncharacterized protein n=1 Tax=Kwoniella bestiolae CBS 10118 TaxID=1296100 RepID=A0A1B9FW75_9TREE|nr:hypothetical protein I302_07360 [Kwoniella bestiolae CBS 10118]OCF23010.1 hypothetical protein I302_07360 [Kwoniella bestiolae CBS 10118]